MWYMRNETAWSKTRCRARGGLRSVFRAVGVGLLIFAAAAKTTFGAEAAGRVLQVAPSGDDAGAGSKAQPWRTLGHAFAQLRPGDTLNVGAGTYFERATVSVNGTPERPIVIQAAPNAVMDSGFREFRTAGNRDWELVDAALGEYRSVKSYGLRGHLWGYVDGIAGYENGRVVLVPYVSEAAFRSKSEDYVDRTTPFYVGPGVFRNPVDGRIHIRLAKTQAMREAEARYGMVFKQENADPCQFSILLSEANTTLTVAASHVTLRGLTVHQATRSVELREASHVRFEDMTIWLGDRAIHAQGSGVHHITVTRSRIYGDAPYWIFWSDMKSAPAPADRLRPTSINLAGGTHDWEISHSHIRGSGQDLIGLNDNEYNISIHHNRLENGGDDAFELEGTTDVGRVSIYENVIRNCLMAVAPGQDTKKYSGPLYFYRNLVVQLRNLPIDRKPGINRWARDRRHGYEYGFKHNYRVTTNVHYYHNTLVVLNSNGGGITPVPGNPNNTTFANNLIVMVNGQVAGSYRKGENQIVDGNLYWKVNTIDARPLLAGFNTVPAFSAATGFEKHGLGQVEKQGTNPHFAGFRLRVVDATASEWVLEPGSEVFEPADFFLRPESPAIGAGIELPERPGMEPLPDTRRSRDIGAFPFGAGATSHAR